MLFRSIEGLDGIKKMSKSLDNYIGINESPDTMFGKLMCISDELMWRYINLLSFKSNTSIQELKQAVEQGLNPRDVKIDFAKEIVSRFHNKSEAENAHQAFIERFQKGNIPQDLEEIILETDTPLLLAQLLKQLNLTESTSEAMRLIKQGAVKIDGERASDPGLQLPLNDSYVIQVGKRRIAKVAFKKN